MAISVADNFSYQGGKPLDARMKFSTVSEMVGTAASVLYDGCFAYVAATKKYYSYDSTNDVDQTLGKWREYSSGGGDMLPTGGTTGQALVKHSNADNDVEWGDVSVDVDTNPTQGSANPVSSGGVYTALSNKVDKVSGKGLSTNDYDNTEKGKVTSAKDHADIEDGSNPHKTTFDNLAVRPEKAALSDLTITDPGYKAYGEIIDLTGKEYVVGDYILANGKKQPLYQRTFSGAAAGTSPITLLSNATMRDVKGLVSYNSSSSLDSSVSIAARYVSNANAAEVYNDSGNVVFAFTGVIVGKRYEITVAYTKSTDTPS